MAKIIMSVSTINSDAIAGRIRDRLSECYGNAAVFIRHDSIPLGKDFRAQVREAVLKEDIVLAIIRPKIGAGRTKAGVSRINEETDPVRIELEIALERGNPRHSGSCWRRQYAEGRSFSRDPKRLAIPERCCDRCRKNFYQHVDRLIRSTDSLLNIKSAELVPNSH